MKEPRRRYVALANLRWQAVNYQWGINCPYCGHLCTENKKDCIPMPSIEMRNRPSGYVLCQCGHWYPLDSDRRRITETAAQLTYSSWLSVDGKKK